MLSLCEILRSRSLTTHQPIKVVRHRDRRWDMDELRRTGHFDTYQTWQSRPVFDRSDFLVSFVGEDHNLARLVGVFRVKGRGPRGSARFPAGFPYREMPIRHCYVYQLARDTRFADLEDRLVIAWGAGTRAWVQSLDTARDKEIVEIRPPGLVQRFPGFLDFTLSYTNLCRILNKPHVHRDWIRALSSVGAVYLITDRRTGGQYVGSAAGAGGLLERWRAYARTGHGGNKLLRRLLRKPERRLDLDFTILQILDRSTADREVLDRERIFKQKLGTRVYGLNSN